MDNNLTTDTVATAPTTIVVQYLRRAEGKLIPMSAAELGIEVAPDVNPETVTRFTRDESRPAPAPEAITKLGAVLCQCWVPSKELDAYLKRGWKARTAVDSRNRKYIVTTIDGESTQINAYGCGNLAASPA